MSKKKKNYHFANVFVPPLTDPYACGRLLSNENTTLLGIQSNYTTSFPWQVMLDETLFNIFIIYDGAFMKTIEGISEE